MHSAICFAKQRVRPERKRFRMGKHTMELEENGKLPSLGRRPFSNYLRPLFRSESWCSSFQYAKSIFIHMKMSLLEENGKLPFLGRRPFPTYRVQYTVLLLF